MKRQKKSGRSKAAVAPETSRKFAEIANKQFRQALEKAGGFPQLGKALGVSRQSVHKWDAIPERFAVKVEELYDIPREQIAPSMFAGRK